MQRLVVLLALAVALAWGALAVRAQGDGEGEAKKHYQTDDHDPPANLSLSLEQVPLTIRSGQRLVYVLRVENRGPAEARNVRLYALPGPEVRVLNVIASGVWDDCAVAYLSRSPTLHCVQAFMPKGMAWVIWNTDVMQQRAGTLINIKGVVMATTTEYNWVDNILDFSTLVVE